MMSGMLSRFFKWQTSLSRSFDRRFFERMSVDGNGRYLAWVSEVVPDGSAVADVGGGKRPFFLPPEVRERRLKVTGVDIDEGELRKAPAGSYSDVIVSALERLHGTPVHDVVIAQSVLEHVSDGALAIRGCASLLKPGGYLLTFCPNRRAWFAVLNRLLPERLKRRILFGVFPEKAEKQGFPAFYDGCTPDEMARSMEAVGLEVVCVNYYFVSSYFMFFFPLYVSWRLLTFPLMRMWPSRYCETFSIKAVRSIVDRPVGREGG